MKITWLTDLHLEFLDRAVRDKFVWSVASTSPEMLVITGDISNAEGLEETLYLFAKEIECPVYFVLGNHDFYHGSMRDIDLSVGGVCAKYPHLHHLGHDEVIEFSPSCALIGHRGWGDGTAGSGVKTKVVLNDAVYIQEMRSSGSKGAMFQVMRDLGQQAHDYYTEVLPKALKKYDRVWIAAHVPPFVEGAWHEGKRSEPDYLPYFSNPLAGKAILEVAQEFPQKKISILCGHTHSSGYFSKLNIECWTGNAIYYDPKVQAVFDPENGKPW